MIAPTSWTGDVLALLEQEDGICDEVVVFRTKSYAVERLKLSLRLPRKQGFVESSHLLEAIVDTKRVTLIFNGSGGIHSFEHSSKAWQFLKAFFSPPFVPKAIPLFARFGRMPVFHELKTHPEVYRAVDRNVKRFEFRNNDRKFEVGDVLVLKEWDPVGEGRFTGASLQRLVTFVLKGPDYNVPFGYAVLSLDTVPE